MSKSSSHKGLNKDEHFLIRFYYTNKPFFSLMVIGAEASTVFLYLYAKVEFFRTFTPYLVLMHSLTAILVTKMLINII